MRNHGFGWPGIIICTLKVTDIISTPLHYNLPRFYSTPRLFIFRLDQLAQAMVTTKDNRSSSLSSVNTKYQKRSHKLQKIQPTAIRKNRSKAPNISGQLTTPEHVPSRFGPTVTFFTQISVHNPLFLRLDSVGKIFLQALQAKFFTLLGICRLQSFFQNFLRSSWLELLPSTSLKSIANLQALTSK